MCKICLKAYYITFFCMDGAIQMKFLLPLLIIIIITSIMLIIYILITVNLHTSNINFEI